MSLTEHSSDNNNSKSPSREPLFPSNLKKLASELDNKVSGLDEVCRNLHQQCCDLEEQVEFAYHKYDDLYNDLNSTQDELSKVSTEKNAIKGKCTSLSGALDIALKEKSELEEQVCNLDDTLDQQVKKFEEKSNILVENCKQLEDLLEVSTQEKEEVQKNLNDEIKINNEFGERIISLEKRTENLGSKLEKKSDAYKHLKHVYFEDKKRWEQKDQRNKSYMQELENKLKMSGQRFSSTSEEVAMIVAWAVKLRKTLNDSKDITTSSKCNLTVSTCPSMDDACIQGLYETPKNSTLSVGSSATSLASNNNNLTQTLSEEFVNISQVKVEMHQKIQSINMKSDCKSMVSTEDDNTEFDSWCGQPHSLATDSFLTNEEV